MIATARFFPRGLFFEEGASAFPALRVRSNLLANLEKAK